jgi:hypothetical protein
MRPLHINLIRNTRSYSLLGWLLFVTGLLAICVALLDHTDAKDQRKAVQARLAQTAKAPRQVASARLPIGNAEGKKSMQRAMDQLAQPWAQWFAALEELSDPQVALLGIDLKGNQAFVRLNAESRNMNQALAYLKTLRASPSVGSAVLSSHEAVRVGQADVIRFTIELTWSKLP